MANLLKMKRFVAKALCVIILTCSGFSLVAQSDALKDIQAAIKASNATSLVEYFGSTVELTIGEQEGTYSKAQAEQIVKAFFQKNKAQTFTVKHSGASSMGKKYSIGSYVATDQSYRTYILVSEKAGKYVIQQLRFEAD